MASPRFDFHIHTKYLRCADQTMEVEAIIRECERIGVRKLGITDHLNNLDRLADHRPIREDLLAVETDIEVYFGAELNFTGLGGDFVWNDEIREELGFQFAIGGIHSTYVSRYDLRGIIDIQHRHHLKTCRDPGVAVLVHPYWFSSHEFRTKAFPWENFMEAVPEAYARELAQVARETGTAIELNADANINASCYDDAFKASYTEYVAILAEEGATFSIGSDAHTLTRLESVRAVWALVESLGIPADRIWSPTCEPFVGGG